MRGIVLGLMAAIFLGVIPASALPPFIIYNYSPPVPQLSLGYVVPGNHQELHAPPKAVTAGFSIAIDPAFSDIKVYDPYNNAVSGTAGLTNSTTLTVSLVQDKLTNGAYRIEWKAVCTCKARTAISGTSYFSLMQ